MTHSDVADLVVPERRPRLRLKPKAPQCGFVDGAWWPHTDDLAAELPELLSVLSARCPARRLSPATVGHTSMMAAAQPGNRTTTDGLLIITAPVPA